MKKKKIIAAICSFLVAFSAVNAFATEIAGDGSASSTVTVHIDSQYTVLIPETIMADSTHYSLSASTMMLCDNEFVNVTVSGFTNGTDIILTNASGNTLTAWMYRGDDTSIAEWDTVASFTNGQLQSDDVFYFLHGGEATPGDYTGTVTFNVSLSSF